MIRRTIHSREGRCGRKGCRSAAGCSIDLHSLCSFDKEWSHGSGRLGWWAPIGTRRFWGVRPDPTNSIRPVLDLERRLRCRECDARGKAVVSIKVG
jgi:hypothetical protein